MITSPERVVNIKEGETFRFVVKLNRASTTDVSFDWSVQHISTSSSDFTGALFGTQLIRAGDTTTTISIDTSDDSIYETDEDFILNITNVTGVTPSSLAASGSIIDNDAQLVLSFEQDYSIETEGTSLTYRLELNRASVTDVAFDWSVQHISTSAEDFTGALFGTQLIRAGDTTTTISIDTSDDSAYETDENFSLNITNVTGATPDALVAGGRIIDNDAQPSIALLRFEQVDSTTTEGASFTYKLELTKVSATNVSFNWYVQHSSTSIGDFTGALFGTQLIRAGDTSTTIIIDTSDDSAYETDENFSLIITNVTGATPSSLTASGRIIDNDAQPSIALLSFEQDYLSATEDASLNYKLQISKASATDVAFDWSVQHSSTSTSDFTGALFGTQLIRAGDTSTTISIDTSDDSAYETDENFSLNITNVTGATPSSLTARGRIIDNDAQPTIDFEQDYLSATEDASLNYKLQISKVSATNVSFNWYVQHSSTSAEDFTGALFGTQLIRAGDTSTTIIIETSDDSAYETDENFSLIITNVTGATPSSLTASGRIIDNDAQPSIALLSFEQDYLSATEGTSLNYKLQISKASATDVAFDWSIHHILTSTSDFTGALFGTQLIRAGDTSTTIIIETSDDSIYEIDENFSLNITNVTGAAPSSLTASGSIIDNDAQPSIDFEQVDSAVTEGTSLNYKLQISKASATNVSFDWYVQHSSTSAEDFTGALFGTQLIRAGDTSTTIIIETSDDSAYETDENFSLIITNVTGATPSSLTASGRIIDNDAQPSIALLSFEQDYLSATEGTSLNYKLQISKASATDVAFDWSIHHILTSTSDFTGALFGTQLIRAGDTSTTISIDTSDDNIYESNEDFSLNITNVTGAAPSSLTARGRIIDNDAQPSIDFEQVDSAVTEGTSLNYKLQISKASATDVAFDWSIHHILTSTSDFTGALFGTQLIRAGDTSTTISIDTSDDSAYEIDENFSLNITNVTGATPSSLTASGSIIDNDAQPSIDFEQVDSAVTEGTSLNYKLQISKASATDVAFDWSIHHILTSTSDFTGALFGTQLIRAGDTSTTIIIETSDDSIYEIDENFSLNITNVTGATPSSLTASGSIIDNDAQPSIDFEQVDSAVTEGTSLNYKLQISKASATDVAFDWSIHHILTSTSDFTSALFGTQLIRAGDTSTTISIDTSDDSAYEIDENFSLIITNVTGATPSSLTASGSIIDNDAQPTIDFEQDYLSATEDASLNYKLQISKASATDVAFDWSIHHILTSTSDFTGALFGTQLIRAGDTSTTISIDTSDDSAYEIDENFSLIITNVTGATPSSLTASGRIIDNDAQPSIDFEQDYLSATEDASLNYKLQISKVSATNVSFDWSIHHILTSTSDFTGALFGTQLIRAGDTSTTISIDTSDDNIYEGNEDFSLNIINVTGAAPSALIADGRIIDNDPQPTIDFEQDYLSATEDASLNYKLQISKVSATNVSFDWSIHHILTSTSDFTGALFGTQLIRAGDTSTTISIDTSDDNIYESNEDFSLNITNVTGAAPSSLTARGRIIDNDAQPSIDFEQVDSAVTEGTSLNYKLQISKASATDVAFDWSIHHILTSTSDFTGALFGTQLIRAGDTSTTISIDTSDDNIYEGNEDFSLNIINVTGAAPSALVADGRIIDNDAQPSIDFEQVDSAVTEGTSLNYKLQISKASATDVAFDWSIHHILTSTSDFTGALFGTQLIRAGDTSTTIIIDTSDDSDYEIDENFSLIITNVTGATPSSLTASGRIIDNDAQPSIALLSFEQDYLSATEDASLNYKLQISKASATDVAFDWSIHHILTSTSDFTGALFGTQLIRAGDTSTTISIDTSDDNIYEGNEDFSLNIINVTGAAPSALVADGRIIDNDAQPSIDFEQVDSAVTEGTSLNYKLQISKASATDVAFDWSIHHILTSTSDFTGALFGTQLIRAGDTSTTISIDTSDDSIYETDENFSLNITNVTGATPSSLTASGSIIDNDAQPTIDFEQDYLSATEDASLNYKLQISKVSATDVAFDWSIHHILTSTSDFTGALFGTQLIRAGDTSTTIIIDTSDDSAYEIDENFSLIITNVTGATPSSLTASGRIIDNDAQPTIDFEQDYLSATEDASLNYKLQISKASAVNVSFDWSIHHILTSTSDFTGALFGTQLIRAGDTSTTISIDTSDDSDYEIDENFSLIITNVTGATPSSLTARGSIINNDSQPSIDFEQDYLSATEDASLNYKLQISKASATNVSFDWSIHHILTSTSDFTSALFGTQLIRAGDTSTTISIDTSDDSAYEGDENFSLIITNVTGATPSSLTASGSIIDNDAQPTIDFEQDYLSATEDASLNYKLQISKASATDVAFDWSIHHILTSTSDFTGALFGTQLIRAGDTSTTISIDTSDDSAYEIDENFSLIITNVTGATPSSLTASGSIIDNDAQPTIDFEQDYLSATEDASLNYKLQISKASATNVSFDWSIHHILTSTSDFTSALFGTQLIRAGDTSTTISIDTSDDSAYEGDESFSLIITNVTGATPSSLTASGSIIDNDAQPTIDFEQDYLSATEDASLNYKLQISKASATNVSFDWSIHHILTSTSDFTSALFGTQLIRAGDTSTTISIDTSDDSAYEGDESFSLIITNVTGATPSSLTASGSIIDNDAQPTIDFEQDYLSATEDASLNYKLQISKVSATDVAFDWSIHHILTSTSDFTGALFGTQLIRAGDTSTTISIDTSDDNIYEGNEDFSLNIINVTGAAPSALVADGRIIDNDPQPTIDFEQDYSSVTEGGSLSYTLRLTNTSTTDISFDWSVQHSSTSTSDFTGALFGTQLIRAGDTSTTIIIETSDDNIYEGNEDFSLNIINVTGAAPSALVADGRIIDNDPQPTIDFEQDYLSATEDASLNYKLQISKASAVNVSFDWSIHHILTSTSDFTGALFGTQLIRAGDTSTTISIDTSDDSAYEIDENFSLIITNVTGATPSSLTASGRIVDNDAQLALSFEQVDSAVTEGTSFNYRLQLNRASATNVSFDWSVQHSSTSTSDFTGALFGTQLIRAGDTSTTIIIETSDDSAYEIDENFSLIITNVTGAASSSLTASGSIIDNDAQPSIALLSFEQDYSITAEGTSLAYRLQISKVSATDVAFDWSVQHSSTSTSDFTEALAGSQRIAVGSTTVTISIDTSDDNIYEGDEDFILNITNVTGATPSSLTARGRIVDNDAQLALSFEQVDSAVTEGTSFNYRLQLNRASATNVSFDWSVQHSSTSTSDFTGALAGSQLIRAGDTSTTIIIDTSDDNIYEGDESFTVNITNIRGSTSNSLSAGGSIIDNETQLLLSFEQSYSTALEGTSFNYRLQLNKESTVDVVFDWSVQHSSTSAEDFTSALFGTQLIRAGDTSTTIIIDTSDDSIHEGDEIFTLNITKITGAAPSALAVGSNIIDNDAQLLLSFEQSYSIALEGTSLNYRLELNKASATNVSFDWSVQHSSTSTEDFTGALFGTQLIRAGNTSTTIIIETSDDSAYEGNEVFSLNITKITGAVPNRLFASGNIIDNDAQLALSFEQSYSIALEGTSLNYRLELNKVSATNVSFDWSVQHSSTSTSDFTGALTGSQLIRAGDTTTTISIDTSDDNIYEGNEIFSLNITKITGAVPNRLVASGNIIDNDAQLLLSFEQDYSSATEDASLNYRLQLNRASATDISFDWSVQHISTSAEDFTGALFGTQLIRAGDTSTTISIDTSDDNIYEGNENFILNITKITGAVPNRLVASGRIIDNDTQLTLSFEQDYSITAEGTSLIYRLELNKESATDVIFDWSVQHSSTSAEDFTVALFGTKRIAAGSTTTTISIDTSDDSIYEGNEIFSLNIINITGAVPNRLVASGNIIDNDVQLALSFEQDYNIAVEGTSLNYKLQLNRASATDVTFDWSVQHSSTSTSDFTGALFGTKRIAAGTTTTTISIDTSDDSIYEGNEIFSLNIINITGAVPNRLVASGRVIDNDAQLVLSFEQVDSAVTEGTSFNYRLQLNRASATNVSFDWSVQHSSTSTSDFTGIIAGSQLIRAGSTTTTISIDTSDDNIYEGNEIFSLNITKVTGAVPNSLAAGSSIIDNDAQLVLSFEQDYSSATEDASLNYRLQLNRASATDVAFDWSVQHSSTSAEDFTGAIFGTQLIRAGDTSTTISIDTSDDNIYEGNEDFSLNITNITGAVPNRLVASGRIIDNDPQPTIFFEQIARSVLEGANFVYRLRLNQASAVNVSFDWSVQHSSTSAEDFTGAIFGTQLIRAGDTSTTISIDTSDDNIYEGNEDFSLNIINVTGASPSALVADGRIIDNDPQPTIDFEQDYSSVTEGGSLSYTLQLTNTSTTDISFDWSVQHSSTSTSDFTGVLFGTKQIRAGSATTTISIDTSDDNIYEGNEDFSLNIINVTGASPSALVADGRIIDNDPQPTIDFEQVARSALEGANLVYTLQLTNTSTTDISFDWSVQHSSTSASDFTGVLFGTKQIRAGSTTATISIDTSDDSIYEGNEDFSLNIINVTGAAPSALVADGRIIDNDPQPTIDFEQDYSSVTEGGSLSYTLQLTNTSTRDIAFDWSVQHSSTSVEDFRGALRGTKQIRAGSTTTTISIDTSDDSIYEDNEDFSLNITNITGAIPDALVARGSIINNDPQPTIVFEQVASTVLEGASINYKLQLNKASAVDVSFDWFIQHSSTSVEDFTGATFGAKILFARDTTATIELQINDDDRPEQAEDFTLHITNIRGATPNSLSTFITILKNDIDLTVDYDGNGLIDIVTQEYFDNIRYNLAGTSYKTSTTDTGMNCGGSVCRGYELFANLDLSAFANWQPIGSENDPFTSILQGNGYSITNLAIDRGNNIGLFSALSGATIDDLVVEVVSITGDNNVGALAGRAENSTISRVQIRAANTNSKLSATGHRVGGILGRVITDTIITNVTSDLNIVGGNTEIADYVGGIVGYVSSSTISYATSSGSVFANGGVDRVGGLVGHMSSSKISYSSTSGSVTSNGNSSNYYGGLVGYVSSSKISYSSASGGVTSNGDENLFYGGLAGAILNQAEISYSSASGNMNFNGDNGGNYGGLVGYVENSSTIRYSSAIGNVIGTGSVNRTEGGYGGLVGFSDGDISHSWSSSSVFASDAASGAAGLVNYNEEELEFSYALGAVFEGLSPIMSGSGLVSINNRRITNSYWNSETSGALTATKIGGSVTNIASSNTAGMLVSTGSARATIFQGFAGAIDELGRNIWTFTSGNYPVITELGVDKQAVSLAYGLLRLASPYVGVSNLDSFLGGTLNNKDIELIANSYNARNTLAILDVNLLQSNSATCAAGSGKTIMTTTGANGATIALQKIAGSIEIEKSPSNSCEIIFSNQKTDGTLQLAAIISKGAASLTKKFEITLNAIQSIISLQPSTLITREGDELVFRLELNHRASRDFSFDWSVQHSSTSTSDFTGAIFGSKTILAEGTDATIRLQINDDDIPENAEDFTLNITNIRGVTHGNLSASITIVANDLNLTVDYDGNGLIDLVTQEHFDNIRYNLAGTSYKTSTTDTGTNCGGSDCRGYELFANLDLSSFANWQPIGSENDPFTSILQGNGYSIANLAIDRGNNIGLFSALSGATIDNLVVEVASISGDSYVGALAGRAEQSTISRVQIRAVDVNSKLQATGHTVGGILGETIGTTITNVISDLSIVGGNTEIADYVGGIVGYVSSSTISYATNSGSVSASGGADNVGGLVGELTNSTISYSSSSSSVSSRGTRNYAYGGLVGYMSTNSDIHYSSASGSVTSSGDRNANYGGLVGQQSASSDISYSSASSSVSSSGDRNYYYGGLVGTIISNSTISDSSTSASVTSNGYNNSVYGGLVGRINNSTISYSSASASVSSTGDEGNKYGGLAGEVHDNSTISYSSASGSVSSSGASSGRYGGLVGELTNSTISYSSASGNVISDGDNSNRYGGLAGTVKETSKISNSSASGNVISNGISHTYGGLSGLMENDSTIDHSSASGNVISSGANGDDYGGLVGESFGVVTHSWSSSSVFTSNPAGLVGDNTGSLKFSYALGDASYGLVATNTGTITNSYWNSETGGALTASQSKGTVTNIASSDTAGMLASTGSAGVSVFADFADATDKHNQNIWTFTSGNYPVITELGLDKQAVSLSYGLLRLASPYVSDNTLNSFLGGTLNNENIELIANSYNVNGTLAILDINLLQSNSAICAAGSTDTILTTTGANGATIALQKIAGSIEIEKSPSNSCEIIFSNQKTDGTLQLAAIISKGAASLTKKFEITLKNIQSIIALHPTKASASEGDELVFTLELNHRASRNLAFDWYLQHSSTSVEDFRGATFGDKILFAGDTTTAITLEINDDDRPERAEDFTLHITNIRGAIPDSFSTSITILENDLDITLDYDGNGLIDLVTQEHFDNIRYNLAGTSYKTSTTDTGTNCGGSDCRGYELLANLDLSSFANWQPIGSLDKPFTSILQGNGYSITNLAINGGYFATDDRDYLGLFATLSGATIDNLVVEVTSISGNSYVGALAGSAANSIINKVQIRAANTSSTLSATGHTVGGILGRITETTITNATSDLDVVGIGGVSLAGLGGIVGYAEDSSISHAYSSASVSVGELFHSVGGLVGFMTNSRLSYSSASGSVSGGGTNENHGGLVGYMESSSVSYSSASGSVISSKDYGQNHGGLVGYMTTNSSVSYSSASGSVIDLEAAVSFVYGGLVGYATNSGKIIHSWSSSSVGAVAEGGFVAGLIGHNEIDVKFSYVLGTILPSGFGLVNTNLGTIANSYWNSETSGALAAGPDSTTNIASSDTAGMLGSTGSANARIFKGFFDATDELNRNIWTFASDSYPVITELGIDEQAVALAYGLLRLAHPTTTGRVSSFLGGTLHNENIELDANDYSANDTLAILDVNLLQSNSAICAAGSTDTILTTTGANQAVVTLSITAATNNLHERIVYTGCSIAFDRAAVIQAGDRLQLAATITKGSAILSKKFVISFR